MADEKSGGTGDEPTPFELDQSPAGAGAAGPRADGPAPVTACPECKAPLAEGATLCVACGFNLMTMAKVAAGPTTTEAVDPDVAAKSRTQKAIERAERERVRTAEREEELRLAKLEAARAMSEPGGLSRTALLGLGGLLLAFAVALGWFNMLPEASGVQKLARGASVVLGCVLHVGTGLGAVWAVAQVQGRSFGRIDLAAERLFVSVAACLCVLNLSIPVPFVGVILKVALAVGAYFACVLLLMAGRDVQRTMAILIAHSGFAGLVYFHASLWAFANEVVVR